jgi:hypothetical protein
MSYLGSSVRIYHDRYGGTYYPRSRMGFWIAVDMQGIDVMSLHDIENGILGGDVEAMRFWEAVADASWIATGKTPNDALAALEEQQRGRPRKPGWPPPPIAQ